MEFGRHIDQRGRGQQVAKRNARIERRHRHGKITTTALLVGGEITRCRPWLRADQQRREVRGGNFNTVKDQLRDEHRTVDDDHGRSVGQGDDEIASNDVDIAECDSRREGNDAIRAGDNSRSFGGELGQVADVDDKACNVGRAGLVRQRVMESVGHSGGGAGVAFVAVIAASIDAQRAILPMHRQLAGREAAVASAGTVDGGNLARAAVDHVEPGRAGDSASAGNHITSGGAIIACGEMICVIARINLARSRVGRIFVSHSSPSPLPRMAKGPARLIVISRERSLFALNRYS